MSDCDVTQMGELMAREQTEDDIESSILSDLLRCPICGGKGELRPGELKPTLEEAIMAEKNVRCSTPTCFMRFVHCTVSEWNTRAI